MGNDPKSWAKLQLSLLPLVLVDWFILPGLLTSEEEIHVARERLRRDDDGRVLSKRKRNIIVNGNAMTMSIRPPEAFTHPIIANSNLSSDDDEPILQSGDLSSVPMDHSELSSVVKEKVMDTKSDDEFVEASLIDEPSLQPNETCSEALVINNERYRTTPPTISEAGVTGEEILRDLASIRERQDFVEKILNREDDARRRRRADRVSKHTVEKGGEIGNLPVNLTPTDRSTSRDNFALFPRTTPTIIDRLSSRDHFDDLIINPDARRLLESTASKLKIFSPRLSPSNDILHDDGGKYYNEVCRFSERQVDIEILRLSSLMNNKIEEQSTSRRQRVTEDGRRSRRCERLSLGDHLRELVTGDANIPIRAHLFDLDLPSTPEKKRGSKQSNVATSIHLALLPVDVSMIRPSLPAWVDNSDESGGDPCISPTKISRPRQKHNGNMQQQEKVLSPHVTTRRKSSRLAKKERFIASIGWSSRNKLFMGYKQSITLVAPRLVGIS